MMARFVQAEEQKSGAGGFTLVEIMIGVGALGLMMGAFFAGLADGFAVVDTARQDLRATQILTQKTEAVRLCTWTELNSLPSSFQDYYYSGSTNGAPSVTYYGTISVGPATCVPATASYYSNIDLVTINLTWTNYLSDHAVAHSRSMQTLVSYNGLVNYVAGEGFVQQ